MLRTVVKSCGVICLFLIVCATELCAQKPPYDVFPPAEAPYYRVRYEASDKPGELRYGVNYTIWIPPEVKTLRGVIVHQHGCGEGSCKSGLTGAYDLHWQALAKKHDCALLSPSYEQPDKADCQMWCDPRNGSDAAFQKCLADLGAKSNHPELAKVPWALWGHSGGGHWAGGMVMLHPDRIAAAWLRSGVPLLKDDPMRKGIRAHTLPDAALQVPMMCNLGTKEGVTVKDGNFAGVWRANEVFFNAVRGKGGLVGVAIDPLSSHDCGNQRYLAIPWLDACLTERLPKTAGDPLVAMPTDKTWLATPTGTEAVPAAKYTSDPLKAAWLPNEATAKAWMEYVKDTKVSDTTPPPAPTDVRLNGNTLTWTAEADLESGLASFLIERDGKVLATVPEQGRNPFGRPIFQNLQYSDTPTQPLVPMQFTDTKADPTTKHTYRVIAVNTVGLKSKPSAAPEPTVAANPIVFVTAFAPGDRGGIHAYELNVMDGSLKPLHRTEGVENPFFLALAPGGKHLYSIHAKQFGGKDNEQVAAYEVVGRTGELKLLNRQSAEGTAACYLDVDKSGKTVLVANYSSGSVAALPIQANGSLGEPTSFHRHTGSSVDPKRQKEPHAHCIVVSPDNKYAFSADLGTDQILCYKLDPTTAKLTPNKQPFARSPAGAGPRHLTFHPNGKRVYTINELLNSITVFDYDGDTGVLTEKQTISTLPADFKGTSYCADVKVSPDGRYLYGTNRGHDSIAAYKIGDDGRLSLIGIEPSLGKGPQNLAITPDGVWLLCANLPGSSVAVFRIDAKTGKLTSAGEPVKQPNPSCIMLLP